MNWRAIIAVTIACYGIFQVSHADAFNVKTALPKAETAAVAYWQSEGYPPACSGLGTPLVVLYQTALPLADTSYGPVATMWTDVWGSENAECIINIDQPAWTSYAAFCYGIVHEYGHLVGFSELGGPFGGTESASRTSVEYPIYTGSNLPVQCGASRPAIIRIGTVYRKVVKS